MRKHGIYLIFILIISACGIQLKDQGKKTIGMNSNGRMVNVPVVEKVFVKKNRQPTDNKELYLRMSTQDYYIKFAKVKLKR